VQATLRENRVALKQHIAIRLRWHMKDLLAATRGYSTWRDPLTLIKVQDRFTAMLDALPGMPRRTLVISAEELLGHLPGRGDLKDYAAAPDLLYAFWEITQGKFPKADKQIYLTTRAPTPWLESAYWEHVKSSSMVLSLAEFATGYAGAANLDDIVTDIASRVPCPVHTARLENCAKLRLGPADPLLDLCDIPADLRATLTPAGPRNMRLPQTTLDALLEANRTHQDPDARRRAKDAILHAAGQNAPNQRAKGTS